ncbi:MAG: sugar transferase [Candidatus Margulisbacteria bacterium]|nr:sugar transferase [Candidatus Margulisiibacteriota bacterium]
MMIKVFLDAFLINISFILAYYFRFRILVFITPDTIPLLNEYIEVLIFITLLWLAIFKIVGLYEDKKKTALFDEIAILFWAVTLSSLALVGLLFLYREFWVSRLVVFNAWWISFLLLTGIRLFSLWLQRSLRSRGWGIKRTLILGAGEMGQVLALKLLSDKGLGYKVVAFLDDNPALIGQIFHDIKVAGQISQVREVIETSSIDEIIISTSKIAPDKVLDIITECERLGVEFKLVPGMLELIASRVDVDEIGGVPLLTVNKIQLSGLNAAIKRVMDIIISLGLIVVLLPFYIVFALLVKRTSPGPILFIQERVGLDGKYFPMFKFRSMIEGADQMIGELEALSETEGHIFKIKEDPRITNIGKFMRHWSIDEFPQLFNVLFGHMSLVGPRPPLPREVKKYTPWHLKRLRVRPGITGLWQVSGRSLLPFEEMVRLDIYYIENWSLWQDFKILLRTIPVVLFGSGAF